MVRYRAAWLALGWLALAGLSCDSPIAPADPLGPWPPDGPRRLWARPLGAGYSGIVVGDGRLYTMYRSGSEEVVISLAAASGETLWDYRYEATPVAGQDTEFGDGPNAAPLLADGRLFTVGFSGTMHAFDAATGRLLWSHDLWGELGGNVVELGYSSTPAAYRETIIALVGGPGRGAVAFHRDDGREVWRGLDCETSYASPAIMTIRGEDQLVVFAETEVVGADPLSGGKLWRYAIRNQYPQNICDPLQIDDSIFVSTLEAGSRGLRPEPGDPAGVAELWTTRKMQCFYDRYARIGELIYGSSGSVTAPLMTALDARTGEPVWRVRGFNLSHALAVDGRLLLLDDEGLLTLATPGPEGLNVDAQVSVLRAPSRTPPTWAGGVLYARDQREIVALELGPRPAVRP